MIVPGCVAGDRDPRPRLDRDLPAARRLADRGRLRRDPPLPDDRGRDAAGAGRHQPLGRRRGCGPPITALLAARPAARGAADDQHHHRPRRRRASPASGRRREPRRRGPRRDRRRDDRLARAHGPALALDPRSRSRDLQRGDRAGRGRRLHAPRCRSRPRDEIGELASSLQRDGRRAPRARADPRGVRHLPRSRGRRLHPLRGLRRGRASRPR